MAQLKKLKAFIRYDGSGRAVPSSLILRKNKPKVGTWHEVPGYECCNQDQSPVPISVESLFPFTYPDFVLQGYGGKYMYLFSYSNNNNPVADVYELAASLNSEFSYYGHFKVVDGNILLYPTPEIAAIFASSGATHLHGYTFAD